MQKNIYILLLFWVAGFATYLLLRLHRIGSLASMVGGLAFLFSGAVQQVVPSIFMGQAIIALPCLLLASRWFLNRPSWRRTAGLAGAYAFFSLASFPPVLCAAFGFAVFYVACALILERPGTWRTTASRFVAAAVLSLGLTAIYYIPVFLTMAQVDYVTEWYRDAALSCLEPWAIFGLLSPTATGGALIYARPVMPDYGSHLFYVGAGVLFLAALAPGKCREFHTRTLLVAGSIAAALTLLKIFGVPPVQWIAHLPVLQSLHYAQYFGILVAFLLSMLAAIGLDRLLRDRAGIQVLIAICITAAILTALWFFANHAGALREPEAWRWLADYNFTLAIAATAAGLALLTFLRGWGRISTVVGGLLLALIFIEGKINATYPRQPRWDVYTRPPHYVSVLQGLERPARLFTVAAFNANVGAAFGVDVLDSLYMFSPPRIYNIYQQYASARTPITMREANLLPPDAVLDRAGIGYILMRQRVSGSFPRPYPLAYEDELVRLVQRGPAPRYFFTSDYQVTDRPLALQLIATAPPQQVLLESAPPFVSVPNRADDPAPELISSRLNSLALSLPAPRPGLLYMADAYAEGWTAKVNGRPAPILPANYGFRAVAVPAGDIRVELSYLPPGLVVGALVSVVCLVLVMAMCLRKTAIPERLAGNQT